MKSRLYILQLILLLLVLKSCKPATSIEYSFFAAGHVYGNPKDKAHPKGLYKPFKEKFQILNDDENMKMGFMLGDFVWKPNAWKEVQEDILKLNMPIYAIRGNHDGTLEEFESIFGKTYHSFIKNKDLFIVLDPNIDQWNIFDDQLIFLKNTLRNNRKSVNNIFILFHQVIWWSKNKFSKSKPNSIQNRAKEINYWSVIEPILKDTEKPVYLFAGDVGAFSKEYQKRDYIIEYSYFKEDNITYVATGMGGGIRDNFVIVDVLNDGSVKFRLIHLNGNNING